MQVNDAANLIAGASALMERFERRAQQMEQDLRDSHHHLQRSTQQLPTVVRQATEMEMQRLPATVMEKIGAGIQMPVSAYEQRLQTAGQQLQQASQALSAQIQSLQVLHRHLVWKVAAITVGSLALVLLGGGWLSQHYYDEIRRNQVTAELLKAYNAADVTLCGDQLCANVDVKGEKFGNKGQYRPVRDRP